MPQNSPTLYSQFAQIVNGNPIMKNGVCSVELERNLHVTIQGFPSRSALLAGITFESLNIQGNALNLVEVAVLQEVLP